MKKLILFFALLFSFYYNGQGQAGNCENSDPFCTSSIYTFPAGVGTTAQSGPNYGCLNSQPNPAWYHMKIAISGSLQIKMFSTPSRDIDFICWGPFNDPYDPCTAGLTANKIVDCSYSTSATEYCDISNGQVGEYYILLITNYSNLPCNITFQKTSGSGETDCTIVPPPISNNGPLCVHDNLLLQADTINNANYAWTGPNGWSSFAQNPVIINVGLEHAGIYQLIITVNGSPSDPVETNVIINALSEPDFTFNEACYGDTTFFIDESTVDPTTSSITQYNWDFGDGNTGSGTDQVHMYGNAGAYNVTLKTYTGLLQCERSITKVVNVYSAASVDAGDDITIPNGWTTVINGEVSGGSGSYEVLWQPENLLEDATIVSPTTLSLGATQIFKLNVSDQNSGCQSSDSMTVIVTGGALGATASSSPSVICQDDIVHLNVSPTGGSGNNVYTWRSEPPGFTADIKEPSDYPQVTTTYYVSVFDGQNTVEASVNVQVKEKPIANAGNDITINVGTSTTINGASVNGGTGVYDYLWTPADKLIDNTVINPETAILETSTQYTLVANDANGCVSDPDQMTVLAGGDILSVFPTSSAQDNTICQGESATLYPNTLGGSGSYTYKWFKESEQIGTNQTVTVNPWETTTYTVEVNDTYKIATAQITIIVNHTPVVNLVPHNAILIGIDSIRVCVRDTIKLDAEDTENPPLMNYLWSNTATTKSIIASTNGNWMTYESYWASSENPVTGCKGDGDIVILFDFSACNNDINDNESADNRIIVSPNPTNGLTTLTLNNISGNIEISLNDMTGRVLWFQKDIINTNTFTKDISLNELPNGIYIISVKHSAGILKKEIIKN